MDTVLVWFRNDLRVADNHSLKNAIATGKRVIGFYCFDPTHFAETDFGFKKTGKFRAQFLIESITDLKSNLKKSNIDLLLYNDDTIESLIDLVKEYNVSEIFLQREWTQEEKKTLDGAKESLPEVTFHEKYDQFLFHPKDIPYKSSQEIPKVFTEFRKKCEKEASVRELGKDIEALPENNRLEENKTAIPSLEDLGFEPFEQDSRTAFPFKGGETSAMERLHSYFWETKNLAQYKQTRNGLVGKDYSSKFSAWLGLGCISARQIYWEVKRFEKEVKKNQDTYWMIFELIWRDYFKYISLKHGNKIFQIGGILEKDYDWKNNNKALRDWINGNTKYDFVNANMIELKETGWMSNRGRQNVASFWAKEQEQDWRVGASYFESVLIDYDVHSNWGNWMYNAGVGNDPRDRRFNIEKQANNYDPNNEFVDLWLD
ncbi:DASH family cryptochrome [Dokdonia sinensis]|uniref:Cryptochrome DASH n=1 Tax=Dokdonia sinensis TaxID=2479847 RepID=A0A3M0G3N1_9FLAO|nr:DASH family cryptochrome [Dokdonia sinensis]RMB59138.1 DASH family cryptochrome [Dokdonia sinensis]